MRTMFWFNTNFDQPLGNWNVSNVTDMERMFSSAVSFNQDISNWCVEQIPIEPKDFSLSSPLQFPFKPNWGDPCPLVSTEDFIEDNLVIYPNPTTDWLYVKNRFDIRSITVFDFQGKMVETNQNASKINLQGLKSGPYLIRVVTNNNQSTTRKIIKR